MTTVLQGGLTSHFYGMGVMPMKNHFDFNQYNLADWVQTLVSSEVCSHGYGLPSLNRNYNPLSRLYR